MKSLFLPNLTCIAIAALFTGVNLGHAQTIFGGNGIDMNNTGVITNLPPLTYVSEFQSQYPYLDMGHPLLQGFAVPMAQLTGVDIEGNPLHYVDLIPFKASSLAIAASQDVTASGTFIDESGVTTNGLSLLDGASRQLVPLSIEGQTLKVAGQSVLTGQNAEALLSDVFVVQSANSLGSSASLLFEGTYGDSGAIIPVEGSGARMMWYPEKAAFRAGFATGSNWDDGNTGTHSAAFGHGTRAGGDAAFAAGFAASAEGAATTALGHGTSATAFAATALGRYNESRHADPLAGSVWQDDDQHAVLEVGIGTSASERKNALTVLQDGSVEVGKATDTDDAVPLRIKADGSILMSKAQGDISMGAFTAN